MISKLAIPISDRLRSEPGPFRIIGSSSKGEWSNAEAGEPIRLGGPVGLVEWHPADMVVAVTANTPLRELQAELRTKGQCLPFADEGLSPFGTVGGEVAMAFPHRLEARFGGWRDWVLGLRVVLADGTIAKSGSRAVKNVAGFDLHRFMVGSRGTLAVIVEVVLRTYPTSALEGIAVLADPPSPTFIQRVAPTDFEAAVAGASGALVASDAETATLWATRPLRRYSGDWVIAKGAHLDSPTQIRLMKRAKQIFDPDHKLNPGEWGFM